MRKNKNSCVIAGYLYQLVDSNGRNPLKMGTVQNTQSENFGKEFINGTIAVAVDEDALNIVEVHYTFVSPTTKSGSTNNTFVTLKKLLIEGKTYLDYGKDATKVKLEPSIDLNDFVNRDGEITSAKRNEGGFASIIGELPPESERNTFMTDILINRVTHVDADPEADIPADYCKIGGAVFNFRNELLPVEFIMRNPEGMEYFESLEISSRNPIYTKVWGSINCLTKVTTVKEESAFGAPSVKTYTRKIKEYLIEGAQGEPYDFGAENVMTVEELNKAMQDREIKLAEVKKNDAEYKASREVSFPSNSNKAVATATPNKIPTGMDINF